MAYHVSFKLHTIYSNTHIIMKPSKKKIKIQIHQTNKIQGLKIFKRKKIFKSNYNYYMTFVLLHVQLKDPYTFIRV